MKKDPKEFPEDDLVTAAKFGNPIEAHLARTKLNSENILAYVFDEHMISLNPTMDLAIGGIRLKVKKNDLSSALKILEVRTPRSFWAPNKTFFFTYLFGEYLAGLLTLVAGAIIFELFHVFKDSNFDFLLFFNLGFLGIFIFLYSADVSTFDSKRLIKTKKNRNELLPKLSNYLKLIGSLVALIGFGHAFLNCFWFTKSTFSLSFLTLGIWFFILWPKHRPSTKIP